MASITLSVTVGNEIQSVKLTQDEWIAVQSGQHLFKEVEGLYEGEEFIYCWHFNDPRNAGSSLVVQYNGADGFIGSITDAWVS